MPVGVGMTSDPSVLNIFDIIIPYNNVPLLICFPYNGPILWWLSFVNIP